MNSLPSKQTTILNGYEFSVNESLIINSNAKYNSNVISVRNPKLDEIKKVLETLGVQYENIPQYKAGLQDVIMVCVEQAIQRLGHNNKHSSDIKFTSEEIFTWVKSYKYSLTIQEMCLAIKLGSQGEYNESVVYVSATNVIRWIKSYINKRQIVFSTLSVAKEKEAIKTAENERETKIKDYWNRFPEMVDKEFKYWIENGELSESVDRICECLNEIGYLSSKKNGFLGDVVDIDLKKMWKNEVEEKEKYRLGKYDVIRNGPKPLIIYHDEILIDGFSNKVLNTCKKMALEYWFNTIELIDKDEIKAKIKQNE